MLKHLRGYEDERALLLRMLNNDCWEMCAGKEVLKDVGRLKRGFSEVPENILERQIEKMAFELDSDIGV